MKTIVEFFDPYNCKHIAAYIYLKENRCWPIEFAIELQEKYSYPMQWQIGITEKIANAWIECGCVSGRWPE